AASGAVGRLLAGVGGKALNGAAMGAAGGAAEGAVGYGISCVTSEEGCSVSGAAKATAVGAVSGGVFGAAASKFGRKGCTPHSFTGATPVVLANATTKPISEIKVGDYVLTAEPGKKKKEKHKVKAVIVTKTDRAFIDVVVATKSGPKTIQTTQHHQFYEATRNAWTQAADLKAGQKLQNESGRPTVVIDVKAYTAQRVTYDLSVEGLHTYHVGAGDAEVLVHNKNDPVSCLVNGRNEVYDIPGGSSGGHGAGDTIPPAMLGSYDIGVNASAGSIPPICSYCRVNPAQAVDHVEPRIGGGDLTDLNTTPACRRCNSSKRDRVAPKTPPANYKGAWPPPWWPTNMKSGWASTYGLSPYVKK
ncbi:polymorphic toxin-type HINT domain-containing protein, partial [Streptomyces sp. NPDC002666]